MHSAINKDTTAQNVAELLLAKGANPAKKYDKAADKSNITSGIVGIWEASIKMEGKIYKTRIVFNKDWSYSKGIIFR
ncbi:hypothetical protein MASR1M46_14400 [Bacteroidales bacterium]